MEVLAAIGVIAIVLAIYLAGDYAISEARRFVDRANGAYALAMDLAKQIARVEGRTDRVEADIWKNYTGSTDSWTVGYVNAPPSTETPKKTEDTLSSKFLARAEKSLARSDVEGAIKALQGAQIAKQVSA